MENYDWSKFTLRVDIKASASAVYSAWATSDNLETWFLRRADFFITGEVRREKSSFIQTGDNYMWRWFGYDDNTTERGKILEANGKNQLRFTFAGDCMVTVNVKLEQVRSIVELTQENIPIDEASRVRLHHGCSSGWIFYLANLKSVMEGGIDLRNKNEKLRNVITS
jgi:uncharacterized protein YndB with AHSA1/START domain